MHAYKARFPPKGSSPISKLLERFSHDGVLSKLLHREVMLKILLYLTSVTASFGCLQKPNRFHSFIKKRKKGGKEIQDTVCDDSWKDGLTTARAEGG